ncbi:glycoside hydrolase superfamily [Mrakia frigida]|uniref:glycoside hydrolase family 18 protein n=1 Tax=Mrakia frigida TaxID=29902 RepID=UPI003FCC043B
MRYPFSLLLFFSLCVLSFLETAAAHPLLHRRSRSVSRSILRGRADACDPGTFRCQADSLQQCSTKTVWITLQVCSSTTTCSAPIGSTAGIGCLTAAQIAVLQAGQSSSVSSLQSSTAATTSLRSSSSRFSATTTKTTKKGPGKTIVSTYTPPGATTIATPTSSKSASAVKGSNSSTSRVRTPSSSSTSLRSSSTRPLSSSSTSTSTSLLLSKTASASTSSAAPSATGAVSFGSDVKWNVYSDYPYLATPPTSAALGSINHFILSFWLVKEGAYDNVSGWTSLTNASRNAVKEDYLAGGKKLMVSAFGATDTPTTSGYDAVEVATRLASFVKQYDLDGVDIDYEDFPAFSSGSAIPWLITLQQTLRAQLPSPQYIISHAPLAPWFTSASTYNQGGYRGVYKAAGDGIDFFNIQFYNQGITEYTTCDNLLHNSSSTYPGSSLFEIAAQGIPLKKLVIGKPSANDQAQNGYMSTELLKTCIDQASREGGTNFAGAMQWQWDASSTSTNFNELASTSS